MLQGDLLIEDTDGLAIRGDMNSDGEIDITISNTTNKDGRFNSTL